MKFLSIRLFKSFFGICTLIYFVSSQAMSSDLPRRASWEAKFVAANPLGRLLENIDSDSPLDNAGLKVGDVLLQVNNTLIKDGATWDDLTDNLVANTPTKLTVRRGLMTFDVTARFNPVPLERYTGLDVEYGVVENDFGFKQRTIVTLPKSTKGKIPAIFMVQGLSCSSAEVRATSKSNYIKMLKQIVESVDMLVMRIEKPGMGDSQGNCSKTNFNTELHGYEKGLQTLLNDPRIDRNRVLVYGNSMGSAIAPYLANKYQLNGVISDGTFYRSWFEHMLEIERRIKQMQGQTEAQISQQINQAYIPLYYGMLIEKKSYAQVIQENPLLAQYNYHGPEHMYGRPMAYYHQLQDFDFAGQWQQVKVPVRVRWGENDWIMSEADNHMIVDTLKRAGNQNVDLVIYPKLDHWSTLHEAPADSFNGKPGVWEDEIAQLIVRWAKELNSRNWN